MSCILNHFHKRDCYPLVSSKGIFRCMRASDVIPRPDGLGMGSFTCDVPLNNGNHFGPHRDEEAGIEWWGGFGGFLPSDSHP